MQEINVQCPTLKDRRIVREVANQIWNDYHENRFVSDEWGTDWKCFCIMKSYLYASTITFSLRRNDAGAMTVDEFLARYASEDESVEINEDALKNIL